MSGDSDYKKIFSNQLGEHLVDFVYDKGNPWIVKVDFEAFPDTWVVYHQICRPDKRRSTTEYRIILNANGQGAKEYRYFDTTAGFALLIGYVEEYDVFVLWDPYKSPKFAHNRSFQVELSSITNAAFGDIFIQEKQLRKNKGTESIICCKSEDLVGAVKLRYKLYCDDIIDDNLPLHFEMQKENNNDGRRRSILTALEEHPGATLDTISQITGIDESELDYQAHVLLSCGAIHRTIPNKPRSVVKLKNNQALLTDFDFENNYFKDETGVGIKDGFFIPCMKAASSYDRITGFFASTIYCVIWDGLREFVSNHGMIRMLCSPRLSVEDCEAVNSGIDNRENQQIVDSIREEIDEMLSDEDLKLPSKILCCLVSLGILEIKLVTKLDKLGNSDRGMFHDKIGIFTDRKENYVAFCGSMNETHLGLSDFGNSETITVHLSWDKGRDGQRASDLRNRFNRIWNKQVPGISVYDLPEEIHKLLAIQGGEYTLNDLMDDFESTIIRTNSGETPYKLGNINLRPHQISAVLAWKTNGRRGILKHATGSGKTVTGLYCIEDALSRGEVPLIVVPSVDLLKQWETNVRIHLSDVETHLCGGDSKDQWKEKLFRWTYPTGSRKLVIAVINTVASRDFRKSVCSGNHLFILCDEVHRTGSEQFRTLFDIDSGPRLGLSATPERYRDSDGTAAIFSYFGDVVHSFGIKDAIDCGILTEYFYNPIEVHLVPSEIAEWNKLTNKIRNLSRISSDADPEIEKKILKVQIERAKIGKKAQNKIESAVSILSKNFEKGSKWLVYCDDKKQLDMLWNELNVLDLPLYRYYADEKLDRRNTLSAFERDGGIVLSIKCLDEGVDIPSVSHALILASSQNPREFIQRRGRVLRKAEGKVYSYIYDLILTPELNTGMHLDGTSLMSAELRRAIQFGEYAANRSTCTDRLAIIATQCGLNMDSYKDECFEGE